MFATAGNATVVFTPGNNPQPNEENILFGAKETGTLIHGTTNQSNVTVDFSSTQTLFQTAQGQAEIFATDQKPTNVDLMNLSITVPGFTFGDFIMNMQNGNGTATISVTTNDGTFMDQLPLGNGQNFLTITTAGGETISEIDISAPDGFEEFKQPRISDLASCGANCGGGGGGGKVPEPATLLLVAAGLLGVYGARRMRVG
jgi:hypothetical protein